MKLLCRWFRAASTSPSWIKPAALATRLERDDARLFSTCVVLTNSPGLVGISETQQTCRLPNYRRILPFWFVKTSLWSWSAKRTADHSMGAQQLQDAGLSDDPVAAHA
jgi:hypothetical protein